VAWSVKDLHQKVFSPYYQSRSPVVQETVNSSSHVGALFVNDGWLADKKRRLMFAIQDTWMGRSAVDRALAHRIQATFLKLAPDRGSVPPSQNQVHWPPLKAATRKGSDGIAGGRKGGCAPAAIVGEEEDRYQDMDSPEGRMRLDMQLLQLQQEQQMQEQQQQDNSISTKSKVTILSYAGSLAAMESPPR